MDLIFHQYPAFLKAKHEKRHNMATDQLMIAFTNVAPNMSHAVLADLTALDPAPLDSVVLTQIASALSGNDWILTVQDKEINASAPFGPYRYLHVYNNTDASKGLVAYADSQVSSTLQDSFKIVLDFNGVDGLLKSLHS